ncbi:GTPase IMAP family member 8-like [Engraulis encrasicolus]|uniref:GTPase IMAP family member 8-like n=1 Tax=Engraulis encrasicolus TaxID=184585 RepID=UPI002FD318B3
MDGPLNKMREEVQPKKRKMEGTKPRETSRLSAGRVAHISDMRILLLGYRNAGRSSSGNTILGKKDFDTSGRTAECVKREGETAGRHITVVEAPGWCEDYTIDYTTERDKQEIVLSATLCQPGPHAILLVIRVDTPFNETHRKSVQEHLELLGDRIWNHTIVLFSSGDWLGDTNTEQHIESGGEALQWITEKCEKRHHVLDNRKSGGDQVTELLEKIEEMVAEKRGHHCIVDACKIKKRFEKKKEEERRAEERKMKVKKQSETVRSSAGGVAHISDMRIVLLGYRDAGKSSSGNTILGKEEFDTSGRTAESVKREGETADRHITVVEAPGWWQNYTLVNTPERDKREVVLSVSLCHPGPHALVLIIRVDVSFTESFRKAVQEHLEHLGERVWSHTIVMFTRGDHLGNTSIEQHIESEGEALQWVVDKCANRYHVIDNKKSDGGQVTELLEKIEEMVAGNIGDHFYIDENELNKLLEKKNEEEIRAMEKKMKAQKQREMLRSSSGGVAPISDTRMILLGNRNAGKSSSGNTILGRKEFYTSERTAECLKREGETAGRWITVVEAPGWWKNYPAAISPEHDKREIVLSVSLCPPTPHAILLVIRVDTPFNETHRRSVQEHMELLGTRVWNHTILLFTCGDWLGDTSIEQHIESGGEALQWVTKICNNRYHVLDNKKRDGGQVTELLEKIEEMMAGRNGHLYHIAPVHTKKQLEKKNEENRRAEERKMELQKQRETLRSSTGPHALLLVIRVDVPVTDTCRRAVQEHLELLGDSVWSHTILLFTFGDWLGSTSIETYIESGGEGLQWVVQKCGNRYHVVDNMKSDGGQVTELLEKIEDMVAGNSGSLYETPRKQAKSKNAPPKKRNNKTAYLTDWGLANMRDSLAEFGLAASGSMCGPRSAGTELYMPPELLLENQRCSSMSDMWSLGLTYLHMFTGSVPWTLKKQLALTGVLLRQERPHALAKLQPHLTEIVEPLVQYEPQSRMTATDLVTF